MKSHSYLRFANLKLGEIVRGNIVEFVSGQEIIISLRGDLVRVKNKSLHDFKLGDEVLLKLTEKQPLSFQIANHRKGSASTSLNREV